MKHFLTPQRIMDQVALNDDAESRVTIIQMLDNVSIQVNITGDATGEFAVQISNDYSINPDGSERNPGTWTELSTPAAVTVTASNPNPIFFDINQTGAYAIKLVWTDTSSTTGVADAILVAKAV